MNIHNKLKGKKILFLSVQTFNLENEIKSKLEQLGAHVTYYDERPANNNLIKGLIRLKKSLLQNRIDEYYSQILSKTSNINFDYLFVNRGEIVPEFFLEQLKMSKKNCEFIFYTWDSFSNHTHPIKILKYFDRKFTFDSNDALKYNLNFRPLFFLDSFKTIKKDKSRIEYNLLFLGTAHSDRYRISNKVVEWCDFNKLSSFCYYFMHGRLVYLFKKFFDSSFKEFDYYKLSFKSLNVREIIDLYRKSDVILDINHPGQNGLTMRTFESIGARKKLITTNPEVKKYCFYNPNNIQVIDRNNVIIDISIFESSYEDIDDVQYNKLTLEGWINSIFFDAETNFWIPSLT